LRVGQEREPPEQDQQARDELAAVIDRRQADIVARWSERVYADLEDRIIDPTALKNAIDDYLGRLATALRHGDPLHRTARVAWIEVAHEHALTRVRLGFNIDQLVHEFILLRRVLAEVAREEKLPFDDRQAERIADVIDAAIATSVRSYVDSRDFETRRTQAEHIGFLTHELRNPLGAATLAASQARRLGRLSALQLRTLDLLDRSHLRLRDLIDKVLLTERFEAGKVELHPIDTNLGDVLEGALLAAQEVAYSKGVGFRAVIDPGLHLHTDPLLTCSAVQNLVDNAVKFTDHGEVSFFVEPREGNVVFHVRDSCPGIDDEDLRLIFEPFRRGHSGKAGTGLGLAIARHAVEAQGGSIHVESKAGVGCHFWFILPEGGGRPRKGAPDDPGAGGE
jgi:signal transduction histidine kinase